MNIGHIELDFNLSLPACLLIFTRPEQIIIFPSRQSGRYGFVVLFNVKTVLFRFDSFATSTNEAIVAAKELLCGVHDFILNRCSRIDLITEALRSSTERLDGHWIDLLVGDLRDFYQRMPLED